MRGRLLLVAGLLALLAVAVPTGAAQIENQDPFCAVCHTEPESTYYRRTVETAERAGEARDLAAYHRAEEQTRCIDCHSGAGLLGRLQAQSLGAQDAAAFFLGVHSRPAVTTRPLGDDHCAKCHAEELADRSFDNHHHSLIADWRRANPRVERTCVACHSAHRQDGDEDEAFLVSALALPACEACHRDTAPGRAIALAPAGPAPVATATTAPVAARLAAPAAPTATAAATAVAAAPSPAGPAALARGEYLVNALLDCNACHTPLRPDGAYDLTRRLAGRTQESPAGQLVYPNVTPDATGIGDWSEADVVAALRNGVRPGGALLRPGMPYGAYRRLSDGDARAVAAYVKSLPPVANQLPRRAAALAGARLEPVTTVPQPDREDRVRYGEYLVAIADCGRCHTPPGPDGNPDPERHLAGGRRFPGPAGPVYSANLTPHESGLGRVGEEQFAAALLRGERRDDPSDKLLIMPTQAYRSLQPYDVGSIYVYLKSLRPIAYQQQP